MFKRILTIIFLLLLCSCASLTKEIKDGPIYLSEKYFQKVVLETRINKEYISKNIDVKLKGKCPTIEKKDIFKKRFFSLLFGFPFRDYGIYGNTFANLYVDKEIIEREIDCNCKVTGIGFPVLSTIFLHTTTINNLNKKNAIKHLMKYYKYRSLDKRKLLYFGRDNDFVDMEILCNIFKQTDHVLNYLKPQKNHSIIKIVINRLDRILKKDLNVIKLTGMEYSHSLKDKAYVVGSRLRKLISNGDTSSTSSITLR